MKHSKSIRSPPATVGGRPRELKNRDALYKARERLVTKGIELRRAYRLIDQLRIELADVRTANRVLSARMKGITG